MFDRICYRFKFLKVIAPYAKGVKRFWALNFILSVIVLLLEFANPVFYRIFIEDVILQRMIDRFFIVLVGYIAVWIVSVFLDYLRFYSNNRLTNGTILKVKNKIWLSLFQQEFLTYENQDIGNTKIKLEDDPNKATAFANTQTIDYLIAYLKLIGTTLFVFYFDWRLALFSIIVIPFSFYFDNLLSKREKKYNEKMRINQQNMSSWLHASIQGWREVKALNLQRHEKKRFIQYVSIHGKMYAKWVHYWAVRVLVLPIIRDDLFMQFGLYFLGGLLIIFGGLKISDLLVFTTYYGMLSAAVKFVSSADADLQASMPFYDRLIEELKKSEISLANGVQPDKSNRIELSNVTFSYEGSDKNILQKFSLIIEKGERVAITGKSGCGKTTLLKLITGMITPQNGSVSFAGINLKDIDLEAMHKRIGYVMQDNLLFNISIRDNLMYGRNNATEEELIDACKKAHIYDFVDSLPDKLDTVIGERGVKLSGGQRQRIILARLFLRDADIFIFDEATSALDQYSENIIQDAIQNIGKDKTIIVVAHRESSIKLCERRVCL